MQRGNQCSNNGGVYFLSKLKLNTSKLTLNNNLTKPKYLSPNLLILFLNPNYNLINPLLILNPLSLSSLTFFLSPFNLSLSPLLLSINLIALNSNLLASKSSINLA